MNMKQTCLHYSLFISLTLTFKLATTLACNKSSHQIILKPTIPDKDMDPIQQIFIVTYEQSLSADCALDLSSNNTVLALDTLSYYENY